MSLNLSLYPFFGNPVLMSSHVFSNSFGNPCFLRLRFLYLNIEVSLIIFFIVFTIALSAQQSLLWVVQDLVIVLEAMRIVAVALSPVTPRLCLRIYTQLGYSEDQFYAITWVSLSIPLPLPLSHAWAWSCTHIDTPTYSFSAACYASIWLWF